jgi:L-fuculose-phosphate aldolase
MPVAPLPKLRAELVATSRRLHAMGWVANHDGNVSVRLHGNRLLMTPTALSKLDVDDGSLIIVNLEGKVLEGRRKPFSELDLHLAIYRARPAVDVVLHAHPPHVTAFGLAGLSLEPIAMPEFVVSLGAHVPLVPRALPKTPEAVASVEAAAVGADALMLAGNGAATMGANLNQALLRMELLEHYARILFIARQLGPVAPLAPEALDTLLEARKKAGLG